MVSGQVPWKVDVTEVTAPPSEAAGVVAAVTSVEEELPRTVTVTVAVTVGAAHVGPVVVTGSVQLSPVMENLGVWA